MEYLDTDTLVNTMTEAYKTVQVGEHCILDVFTCIFYLNAQ